MKNKVDTRIEVFNECFAMLNLYCIMGLTDITPDDSIKVYMGDVLIYVNCISIGVNLFRLMYDTSVGLVYKIKMKCLKKKHEERLK
jgi:hypothetical protein